MGSPWKSKVRRWLTALNVGYPVPLSLEEKFEKLEKDASWMTIELPIGGRDDAVEEVLVQKQGENRYRIASSPGMVEGLAANDIIALDGANFTGFRLLQRGGYVAIHVFCDEERRDAVEIALSRELGRIGGVLDGTMGRTGLCYTISIGAGFTVIEGALRRVVGEEWSYSNVHDEATSEPLNWWLKSPPSPKDEME